MNLFFFQGVSPADESKHGFWFDVQPTTGTTLSAKARLQVNIAIKAASTFSDLAKVKIQQFPRNIMK